MSLARESCVACRPTSPRVTAEDIDELRPQIPDWGLDQVDGIDRLRRAFKFRDYSGALVFVLTLGRAAEDEGHHPRMTIEWGSVEVEWWTHAIKGLHRNDFVMAAKTDELYRKSAATSV